MVRSLKELLARRRSKAALRRKTLWSRPVMSGDEVALLLETASPKTYTARGTGSDSRS